MDSYSEATIRKTLLMILLAVASGNAAAEWIPAGRSQILTAYYDPASIRRDGDMAQMVHLYDFNSPRQNAVGQTFLSSLEQDEFACKEEQLRIQAFSWHSEHMGQGAVVNMEVTNDQWLPVPPKSIYATLWKIACGK